MKSQCETSDPKEVSLLFASALYGAFVLWLFSSFDYFVFDKVKSDIFLTVWTSQTLLASVFLKPSVISHMIIQFEGWVGDFFDHKKYHSNWFLRLKNRDFFHFNQQQHHTWLTYSNLWQVSLSCSIFHTSIFSFVTAALSFLFQSLIARVDVITRWSVRTKNALCQKTFSTTTVRSHQAPQLQ